MKLGTKENILIATITGATLLSGFFLTLPRASAETEAIDRVTITVPSSCSLSSTVDNPTHTATVRNHEYVDDIGETTIKATCNDLNGFSVYAIGFSDDTAGKTVLSASTVDHANDIVTGTATSGTTSNWAMRLSSVAGTYAPTILNGFDDYSEVPSTYTKVATLTSRTDQSLGSSFTTNYAVYISGSQLADTYTGKVKYTMVHPASEPAPFIAREIPTASGQICYYPNTDKHEGTMGCQTISDYAKDWSQCVNGTNYSSYCNNSSYSNIISSLPSTNNALVTLLASNFSREGYGFAGWSDKFDYATNTNANFYGPQETITIPDTSIYTGEGKGLSLYAVWVRSQGNLQDTTKVASVCSELDTAPTDGTANLSSVSALTDQRDSQTYAIAKLADGKCWMIENLRLEAENTRTAEKQALAQGYGTSATYGNFGGLADAENTGFTSTYSANSLYYSGTQEGTASIDIGTSNFPAYRMPRYNHGNTNSRASNPTTNTIMYSYGNYYTWHAAIADLTYNGSYNQSATGTSLCPKGWHLPTGGFAYSSGYTGGVNVTGNTSTFREFYNLGYKTMDEVKTAYEDTPNEGLAYYSANTTNTAGKTATAAFRSFPNNFLYSGSFNGSSARDRGSDGYYWSSTTRNSSDSHHLRLNSSYVDPGTGKSLKNSGFSIRCISGS